jgi:hypothetical protein
MPNVAPGVPADLTAARIRRAARRTMGPAINEETAREDAVVLHDIIACARQAYTIRSTGWCGGEDDTIETILRTAVGICPEDKGAAASESEWLSLQLWDVERLTGGGDLHRKLLRVCGHVVNFDFENLFSDDETASDEDLLTQPEFTSEDEDDKDIDGGGAHRPHLRLLTSDDDVYDLDQMFLEPHGRLVVKAAKFVKPVRADQCRFPVASQDGGTHLFCAAPVSAGYAYCPAHLERVRAEPSPSASARGPKLLAPARG